MSDSGGHRGSEAAFVGFATDFERTDDGSVRGTILARGTDEDIALTCTAGDWLPKMRLGLAPRVSLAFTTDATVDERSVGVRESTATFELAGEGPVYRLESADDGKTVGELHWDCPAVEWLDDAESPRLTVTVTCDDSPVEALSAPDSTVDPTTPGVAKRWRARPGRELQAPDSTSSDDDPTLYTPVGAGDRVVVRHGDCLSAIDAEDETVEWTVAKDGLRHRQPVVRNGRVYAVSDDVFALEAESGETLWRVDADAWEHAPLVGDDLVFVVTGEDDLLAIEAATGEPAWRTDLDLDADWRKPEELLTVTEGYVFARTREELVAVETSSGAVVWRIGVSGRPTEPMFTGDTLLVGFGHSLWGLDPKTGETEWKTQAHPETIHQHAGTVMTFCTYAPLVGIDPTDGEQLWDWKPDRIGNWLGGEDGRFYVSRKNHPKDDLGTLLYALDPETGDRLWENDLDGMTDSALMFLPMYDAEGTRTEAAGRLLCGERNAVHLFDRESGDWLWRLETKASPTNDSAILVDGTLYVTDREGTVYAIDPATGAESWRYAVDESHVDWMHVTDGPDPTVVVSDGRTLTGLEQRGATQRRVDGELVAGDDGRYIIAVSDAETLELPASSVPDRAAFRGSQFEVGLTLAPDRASLTVAKPESDWLHEFPVRTVESGSTTRFALGGDPKGGSLAFDTDRVPASMQSTGDDGHLIVYLEHVGGEATPVDRRRVDLSGDLTLYDNGVVRGAEASERFPADLEYGLPAGDGAVVVLSDDQRAPLVPTETPGRRVVFVSADGTAEWTAGPPPSGEYRGCCVVDGVPFARTDDGQWCQLDPETGAAEVSE